MTGKSFTRRICAMIVLIALASLLWSCADSDRNMVAMKPPTEGMEPQLPIGNPYAAFPGQGVKAILDAAHAAAIEQPDFGIIKQSLGNNVSSVSEVTVAFDDATFESAVTVVRSNSSKLVFDTVEDISDSIINPSISLSGREGKDEIVWYETDTEIALSRVITTWNPDDLGEWMSGGYWIYGSLEPGTTGLSGAEVGAFIDGPELSGTASLPESGHATYKGFGAGYYTAEVGSDGAFEEGSLVMGEYWGSLILTADFGAAAMNIDGSVYDIQVNGHVHTSSELGEDIPQMPINGQILLNAATFSADGHATGSVSIVGDGIVRSDGVWGVELSSVPDDFDNPRAAAGTSSVIFTRENGAEAVMIGVLYGLSEPPVGAPAMVSR